MAGELTINAYHELGEMLAGMEKDKGGYAPAYAGDTVSPASTLEDLLDMPKWSARQLSKHAQLVARIPEDKLRSKIAEIRTNRLQPRIPGNYLCNA